MNYCTIKPSKKLADYVQHFWIFEGNISNDESLTIRTVANASPELIFHYKGTFDELTEDNQTLTSFTSGIHGQTNRHRQFIISESFGMIGVKLYPYALQTLFDIPAVDFSNQLPDLFSILKPDDRNIQERVFEAENNKQRVSIISEFLDARIKEFAKPEIVFAVQKIIRSDGGLSIKDLANNCAVSQRQFERNFKGITGFTAKSFARIIRFNALLKKANYKKQSLTEIALDFGYYDQSHFIQDFKDFSGLNPKAYFLQKLF